MSITDILKLTYKQFNLLLKEVINKFSWDIKLSGYPHIGIQESDFPTYEKDISENSSSKLSLKEALSIQALSNIH